MDSLTTAESIWSSTELFGIFANEVQPISDTAQSRVLIPDGLDLETWLCPMDPKDFTLPTYTGFYPRIEKQASIHQFENEENTTLKDSNLNDRSALKNETETTHELQSIIRKPQSKKYDLKQNFEDGLRLNEIKSTTIEPIPISEVKKEPKKTHHKKSHKRTSSELHEKLQIHISGKKYKIWSQDGIFLQISWSEQPQSFMQQTKARIDIYMSLVNSEGAPLSFTLDPARKESTMKIRQFDDKYKVLQLKLERPNIESLFSRNIQLKLGLEESTFNVEFHIPFEMNFLLPNQAELATMTPPKFMKILQNPPLGYFSAVGTSNIVAPDNLQLEQVCNLLATSINCIIVERHPAASSLYGLLCNGIPIVGLVKERQNAKGKKLLSIEIKTGDSKVLEWVNEMVSNFASELI